MQKDGEEKRTGLVADWNTLQRIFIRPEDEQGRQTLVKYMEQILFGLHEFLNSHVGVTEEISLKALTRDFKETVISEHPEKKLADVITDIIKEIAPRAVNVTSPYFVGHMTSAIPFFMVHLKTIETALNQNVVKLETSKVLSVLEKQVLAKIHRLIFKMGGDFYQRHVQSIDTSLGAFTAGGTTANITALWIARNRLFKPCTGFSGVENEGMARAMQVYGVERVVVFVSRRFHFSLRKAGGLLGIGNDSIIPVDVDERHRMDMAALKKEIAALNADGKAKIAAVVGIAGATETGAVDPLNDIADICDREGVHFHVDAAWGGPVLFSEKYAHLLDGIHRADSVTVDCHKQFYMPMSSGMIYFRDPYAMDEIAYYSEYVNRPGSVDLGIKSLEGSREASSLILDSALKIMGSRGYALMIEHGIETARKFAQEIETHGMFELVTRPGLNILTYRVVPPPLKFREGIPAALEERRNALLNRLNTDLQRKQREQGKSFVSRTTLKASQADETGKVVLRAVIMNPLTDIAVLKEILDEQADICRQLEKNYQKELAAFR